MSRHYTRTIQAIAIALLGLSVAPLNAEEIPDLTLRYRELTGRQELKFVSQGMTSTKPAGLLNWDFPPTSFATVGFEKAPQTYCIEPQVPVVAGTEYPYRIESFGQPKDYGLKDTDAGRKATARRNKFVLELYGRYYNDSLKDPMASAAFQTALWEVVSETEVPEGPMPFNLFDGTFKADYKNLADSPAFVQQAQKYVQSLTGNDTEFTNNPTMAGLELVRLTGLTNSAGAVGQSQLALRNRAGSSNISGAFGNNPGDARPGLGGLGALGGLSGLGGGGLAATRTATPGLGGGGGTGGFFPFTGGSGTTTNVGSTSTTPTTDPLQTTTPPTGGTSTNPGSPGAPINTPTVPAPPAVVLGGIALLAFGLRKVASKKKAD